MWGYYRKAVSRKKRIQIKTQDLARFAAHEEEIISIEEVVEPIVKLKSGKAQGKGNCYGYFNLGTG